MVESELWFRLMMTWVVHRFLWTRPIVVVEASYPVGLARLIPLENLALGWKSARRTVWLALLLYLVGVQIQLMLLFLFGISLLYQTLACSQGSVRHDTQVPVLVLGFLSLEPVLGESLVHSLCQQCLAAAYFTAALSKIQRSGFDWVNSAPNIGLQIMKSTAQYYHTGHKSDRRLAAKHLAQAGRRYPWLFKAALASALLLELSVPLLLSFPAILGSILLLFHLLIWHFMRLEFNSLAWMIFLFLFNAPIYLERLWSLML